MQISPRLFRHTRSGYALVVVMISMALLLVVFASMMYWAATNAKITLRNNIFTASESAAESSTENILTYMIRDFGYGSLNPASSYNTLAVPTNGWPVYYQFSDTNKNTAYSASVYIGSVPTTATALNSQFAGLYGFAQPVTIASTAAPQVGGVNLSATVCQSVEFALIPLFQFAIFYNMDLEINPGAPMTINGHVHSNDNIWATGSGSGANALVFSTDVDAAGTVSNLPSPLDPQNAARSGNVTYSAAGNPIQDYASLNLPIAGTTNNNPTNVLGILNQPPAAYSLGISGASAAYSTNGMVYFANASDLIVSNAANGLAGTMGTNITVYYQNPNNTPYMTQVPPDVLISSNVVTVSGVKTTNLLYTYSFVTNVSFYDYRESDTNQAVQINVSALNTWLTSTNTRGGYTYTSKNTSSSTSKGHQINSIFVYNNVHPTSSQLPSVRMVNGAKLPNISGLPQPGLTVSTAVPLYVEGNYNTTTNGTKYSLALGDTTNTVPAALLADAVTLLSSNWSDANYGSLLATRIPADIVVNAATLEGIVPSNGANYSGGVENFLRLEENWTGHTVTYNGSIVVMFPSQYATNFWQSTGAYYSAPTRNWGFDLNFNNSARLPPLTPTVKAVIRGNYAAW